MAWQDVMIKTLRIMLNDMGPTYTFEDLRLEQVLLVAARYVEQEVVIERDYAYSFDMMKNIISPDPVDVGDDAFINFCVLKGACIIDVGNLRTKALVAGIRAVCGPASLDTSLHLAGFKTLIDEGPCAAYKELKEMYMFGDASAARAILSPFVGNTFNPNCLFTTNRSAGTMRGQVYY